MKAVTFLTAFAVLLFASGAASVPEAKSAGEYSTYVGCGGPANPEPSHVCQRGERPSAYFESVLGDTVYEVCVLYPTGRELCAPEQVAFANTLYENRITTSILGVHFVVWKVGGVAVGEWSFRLVKPVRAPTIRRPEAERATRSLLREISTWRYRALGFYDCFGGKVNRTEWSCRVAWIKGRRCFRGRVRVFGYVKNRKRFVGSHIRYKRVC